MVEDYGQPRIRYTIVKDFMQKDGHKYKLVMFLFNEKDKPIAKFRICQCNCLEFLDNIKENFQKVLKDKKITEIEEKDEHTRYIG